MINCAGIGARELVRDHDLEPHRGQVAIVPRIEGLSCAIVCDDAPLMYAIPRANDCVFGGTNDVSDNLSADPATTSRIVAECSRVLNIDKPRVLAERVGLRPFRRSGVRLERDRLRDGRTVIHNYGHGGAGFTLSWGCARKVLELTTSVAALWRPPLKAVHGPAISTRASNENPNQGEVSSYADRYLRQRDALKRADDVVGTFFGEEAFVIAGAEVPMRAFVIIVAKKSPDAADHDDAAHPVVPVIADVMETQIGAGVGTFKADMIVKHQLRQSGNFLGRFKFDLAERRKRNSSTGRGSISCR